MKQIVTFIFLVSVIAVLAVVCYVFPQPKCEVGSLTLRFPQHSDVLRPAADSKISADSVVMAVEQSLTMTVKLDSAEQARQDSILFYKKFFTENAARIYCPNDDPKFFFRLFATSLQRTTNQCVTYREVARHVSTIC
ncbi:MAG: hypothetical protein J6Y72_10780 [Bacteroidales bacterium]|nr:hypothetical protein [Bacteroidales bacterium]